MMGYGFGAFGGMGLGMFWGVVVWVATIALLVWAVASFSRRRGEEETPLEVLRRRFARGEITEAEFEQARRRLAS
ncbi:MAG: SHOCT domain-containing protein [Chloroflexota bacterium]|nr:SHOCT domain-containing protein [Chloroflexota bacterium]